MKTRLKRHRFHQAVFSLVRFLLGPILKRIYSFRTEKEHPDIRGPFLVLANHVTAVDPILLGTSFREQMYFVASEHLMQKGFLSALLRFFLDPIPLRKGDSAVTAVKDMLACLKNGFNVCIFPEGTCSFDGRNSPMLPTIGKLARASRATLVTYRFEGGFFTLPRWGKGIRRGDFYGHVERVYPPEELRSMTDTQINEKIIEDLFEDAYQRQEANPVAYRSSRIAERLESAYYLCPSCLQYGTLETDGAVIRCKCGLNGSMDDRYFLHGIPFRTLPEWDDFETEWLQKQAQEPGFRFADKTAVLMRSDNQHHRKRLCSGEISMDREALKVASYVFPLSEILGMEIVRRNILVFSTEDAYYLVTGDETLCTRKYLQLYRIWKGSKES